MSAIEHAAAAYRAATEEFLKVASAVPEADLDRHHPEGWSPRQIIHHLGDVSAIAYGRLTFLLALAEPSMRGFDEEALANCRELGYTELPVDLSLAMIRANRAKAASVIERLTVADLERTGTHTERGTLSVAQWLDMDTRHANEHTQQLHRALQGEL